MINNNCQPPSASGSPRFCNMGNFMRLPHVTSAEGLDFAIVGIPFDIDFVDPAYAPGTGTPEVGGFTSFETLQYIRALKDLNFTGFDVVEVAPPYDHSEITAYMGANIIFEFMSILAYQKKIGKRK